MVKLDSQSSALVSGLVGQTRSSHGLNNLTLIKNKHNNSGITIISSVVAAPTALTGYTTGDNLV